MTIQVRYNYNHYMSDYFLGCIGCSWVGREVERAIADGYTHDTIYQEGLTWISQIKDNYLLVDLAALMYGGDDEGDLTQKLRDLEKRGFSHNYIFRVGVSALHRGSWPEPEPTIDESNLEEERPGVWMGILADAPLLGTAGSPTTDTTFNKVEAEVAACEQQDRSTGDR
ncbi:MAG TPA: hypothetical protein VGC79_00290 [Polyangiaceae bacterium]